MFKYFNNKCYSCNAIAFIINMNNYKFVLNYTYVTKAHSAPYVEFPAPYKATLLIIVYLI